MIFINSSPRDSFKIFQGVSPIFVPFGMGYLLAVLERNQIHAAFFDEILETNLLAKISEEVRKREVPYVFGFNVLTATYKNALLLSGKLKAIYPGSVVVFGGVHSSALPEEVLSNNQVDVVVRGEAESIIIDLFERIKNRKTLSGLKGVSYKENGKITHNADNDSLVRLEDLPVFPHHIFSHRHYEHGYIMTSRGCPYRCIFCSNILNVQGKCRFLPVERAIDELEFVYDHFKKKHIGIIDDNLLVNRTRVIELAEGVRKSRMYKKVVFSFQARAVNSDFKTLKELYDAGFKGVFFGLETASESLMDSLNKGEKIARVLEAISTAKKIGYHVSTNFIFGLPGESPQDRKNAMRLTNTLHLDLVKYNNATPFPGTVLYEKAKAEKRLFVKGEYENFSATSVITENPFRKIPLSYVPAGNTERQIRNDILLATFRFYFRWSRMKRVFTKPDLSNSWFDFGHSPLNFFRKIPSIFLLLLLLTVKFGEMLLVYPFLRIGQQKTANRK